LLINYVKLTTTEAKLAEQQGRMTKKRFQEKTNKYRARVVANGFGFVPIIFESSGQIHDQSKDSFKFSSRKQWKQERLIGTMLMHIVSSGLYD
jgi:hypothetical protein